jgi:hypothetical protein
MTAPSLPRRAGARGLAQKTPPSGRGSVSTARCAPGPGPGRAAPAGLPPAGAKLDGGRGGLGVAWSARHAPPGKTRRGWTLPWPGAAVERAEDPGPARPCRPNRRAARVCLSVILLPVSAWDGCQSRRCCFATFSRQGVPVSARARRSLIGPRRDAGEGIAVPPSAAWQEEARDGRPSRSGGAWAPERSRRRNGWSVRAGEGEKRLARGRDDGVAVAGRRWKALRAESGNCLPPTLERI